MPELEVSDLEDTVVAWFATGFDAQGQYVVSRTPVELPARWTDSQANKLDPKGNTVTVDGTAVLDRDVPIGSVLWFGSLDDVTQPDGTFLAPTGGLVQVKTLQRTADLKARAVRRSAGFMRYNDKMPYDG